MLKQAYIQGYDAALARFGVKSAADEGPVHGEAAMTQNDDEDAMHATDEPLEGSQGGATPADHLAEVFQQIDDSMAGGGAAAPGAENQMNRMDRPTMWGNNVNLDGGDTAGRRSVHGRGNLMVKLAYNKGYVAAFERFKVAAPMMPPRGDFLGPAANMGQGILNDSGNLIKGLLGHLTVGGPTPENAAKLMANRELVRSSASGLIGPAALVGGGAMLYNMLKKRQAEQQYM